MRLTFRVRFHTHPGQSLWLAGDHEIFGNCNLARALPLHYQNDQFWEASLIFPPGTAPDTELAYNYVLRQPDGTHIYDWGNDKRINPASLSAGEVLVIDSWNPAGFYENAFYAEPFKKVLLKENQREALSLTPSPSEVRGTLPLTSRFSEVPDASGTPSEPFQGFSSKSGATHTFKVKAP